MNTILFVSCRRNYLPKKTKTTMKYSLSILTFLILTSFTYAQATWTFEKEKNGVKAFSRIKEGKDFYEFKTVNTIEGDIYQVKKLITDIENFKEWMPNTTESKVLKKINDYNFYAYTVTSTPWPASSRDAVFLMTIEKLSDKEYKILLDGKPDYIENQKNYVRITENEGVWHLKEIAPNKVEITYVGSFNPGGYYANFVIKNNMIEGRFKTMSSFIKELKSRRVQASSENK